MDETKRYKSHLMYRLLFLLFSISLIACYETPEMTEEATEIEGIHFREFTSEKDLIKTAKEQKKAAMMVFYNKFDGPSKWMESSVYKDNEVATFYNTYFVSAKIDVDEQADLAKQYNIDVYPTFIYLDQNGQLLHRTAGPNEHQNFIENGAIATDSTRNLQSMHATYNAGNYDVTFLNQYAMQLYDAGIPHDKVVKELLASMGASDYFEQENFYALLVFLRTIKGKNAEFVLAYKDQLIANFGPEEYGNLIYQMAFGYLDGLESASKDDLEDVLKFIETSQIANKKEVSFEIRLEYYKSIDDMIHYGEILKKEVKGLYSNNPHALNVYATEVVEKIHDPNIVREAKKWMNIAIRIESNSYHLETYSRVLFKLKEYDQALYAIEKSIELAKKEGEYSKRLDEWKATIIKTMEKGGLS